MKYSKPPLTFAQQADLLMKRGLLANRGELIARLGQVNYYRLSGYLFPFRTANGGFLPGTQFDTVWHRYTFDRQLRLLLLDAIERVEVAVRTRMINDHCLLHGPFGYLESATLPGLKSHAHQTFLAKLREEVGRSHETFVKHYNAKYSSETDLPLWMVAELMSFGAMFTLFTGLDKQAQTALAGAYAMPGPVLRSWLHTLSYIRNLCAHHARVWNRVLAIQPYVPRKHTHPDWHAPVDVQASQRKIFSVLMLLRYMLSRVAPRSSWQARLEGLLKRYPDLPIADMGFPRNWKDCPVWRPF